MPSVTGESATQAGPEAGISRRDRLRTELVAEIKGAARSQLEEKGPSGVSWRAIARQVGMSPAALYTYFESLDDLYTELIADSFWSLAEAVRFSIELYGDGSVTDRLTAGIAGYREWSLRFAEEFRLIFQNQIPGYEAPEDGGTLAANLASSAQFLALLVEGWESGELDQPPPGLALDGDEMNEKFGLDLTGDQIRVAMAAWGTFHGIVQLEVNDHIGAEWVNNDQLFQAVMQEIGSSCGGGDSEPAVFGAVRGEFDRRFPDRPRRNQRC